MKESDIRPQELFNRCLELSRRDIIRFFADRSQFVEVACLACTNEGYEFGPEKFGFRYMTCLDCGSLCLASANAAEARRGGQAIHSEHNDSELGRVEERLKHLGYM